MKVYIGPYTNWFGPHQLAQTLCFWAKKNVEDEHGMKDYPEYVFKFGEWLAYGKWRGIDDIPTDARNLFKAVDEEKKTVLYRLLERIESKKKRKIKIRIDKWDTWSMDNTLALIVLPMLKQLKETNHGSVQVDLDDVPPEMKKDDESDIHDRWDWVMDEMIFAFESIVDENSRYSQEFDPAVEDRVANGLKLFGKYYRGLWD